jgi:hypothetical protein
VNKKKNPAPLLLMLPSIASQYTYHMDLIPGHHEKHTWPNETKSGTNIATVSTKEIDELD